MKEMKKWNGMKKTEMKWRKNEKINEKWKRQKEKKGITFDPTNLLTRVDFPAFGTPTKATVRDRGFGGWMGVVNWKNFTSWVGSCNLTSESFSFLVLLASSSNCFCLFSSICSCCLASASSSAGVSCLGGNMYLANVN